MRILTVGNLYPPHLGGYELSWQRAVDALLARGHDVAVLTTDTPPPPGGPPDPPHVSRTLRWYWRAHAWPRFGLRERAAIERHNAGVLARAVAALRPDAVAWWSMGGMSLNLIERVRRAGLPAVGFVLDDWMVYGPQVDAWQRVARRVPARRGLSLGAAARWLFVSEATRGPALARHVLPDTGVLPLAVDPAFTVAPPTDAWEWRLLYAGRIDRRKGIATAVRALAALPDGATLRIIGAGDDAHAAELRALDPGGRISIEPPRDRVGLARAYAEADAVVFPVEWEEPFGLVPLEAMAVGRPGVATGRGGSGDFLRDGDNCLAFAAGDAAGLARALRRLSGDAALRQRLRSGGLATARLYSEAAWHRAVERELAGAKVPSPWPSR